MTQALDRVADLTEFEYGKRCEARDLDPEGGCNNPAKWAVWLKHSRTSCPNSGINMCTECRDAAVKYWEHLLTCRNCKGSCCRRCGTVVGATAGTLSNFVRWIEL